jgi:hypothetical protein
MGRPDRNLRGSSSSYGEVPRGRAPDSPMEPGALRSRWLGDTARAHLPGGTLLDSGCLSCRFFLSSFLKSRGHCRHRALQTVVSQRGDHSGARGDAVKVVERRVAARIVPRSGRVPALAQQKPVVGTQRPVFTLEPPVFTSVKQFFTPWNPVNMRGKEDVEG